MLGFIPWEVNHVVWIWAKSWSLYQRDRSILLDREFFGWKISIFFCVKMIIFFLVMNVDEFSEKWLCVFFVLKKLRKKCDSFFCFLTAVHVFLFCSFDVSETPQLRCYFTFHRVKCWIFSTRGEVTVDGRVFLPDESWENKEMKQSVFHPL